MEKYTIEINNFVNAKNYHYKTLKMYKKYLYDFGEFLAERIDEEMNKLHLLYIYKIQNDLFEFYEPLDATLLDEYFFQLIPKGYSSLSTARAAIGSFIKYLRKNYDFPNITEYMLFKLSHYKPEVNPPRILNRHEMIKLYNSIVKYSINLTHDTLLFTLLISTGCRINELLSLKANNINWQNDVLYIPKTKNGRSFYIVLRIGIGESLKRYCITNNITEDDFIFTNDNGKQLTRHDVNKLLKLYLEKANLPSVNIHSLRHSFATMLAESGVPITTIQQLLNHESLNSTKGYIEPNYIRNYNIKIPENEKVYKGLVNLSQLN